MKLAAYSLPNQSRVHLGALVDDVLVDLIEAEAWAVESDRLLRPTLPHDDNDPLLAVLKAEDGLNSAQAVLKALAHEDWPHLKFATRLDQVQWHAPLLHPPSVRDFYAFEQHVKTAAANRGAGVPAEWYEIPVFYFTNHQAVFGPTDLIQRPRRCQALDFELELAAVIGKRGRDLAASEADAYIAGFTIMNDWSARDLQMQEMKVMLGPAKGKDFATTLGPYFVTPDELSDKRIDRGGQGSVYDLEMIGRLNGREISRGNLQDITFTFAQMIERASADVWLYPGDVIGSGTVGTGCLLELTKGKGPWLQPGDVVELEIERLGIMRNKISA